MRSRAEHPEPKRSEPKSPLRRALAGAALGFALLAVGIAAAPTILSTGALNGVIANALAAESGADEASLGELELAWFGEQRIEDLELSRAEGETLVKASASLDRGLWDLIWDGDDLGTITLAGDLRGVRREDGTVSFSELLPESEASSDAPMEQGELGLELTLELERLDVELRDPAGEDLEVRELAGKIEVESTEVSGQLGGEMSVGDDTRQVSLDGEAKLAEAGGAEPGWEGALELSNFPSVVVDMLYGAPVVASTLGESFGLEASAEPAPEGGTTLSLVAKGSAGGSLDLETRLTDEALVIQDEQHLEAKLAVKERANELLVYGAQPLLADVRGAETLGLRADESRVPLDGDLESFNARFELAIGEVELAPRCALVQVLALAQRDAETIRADLGTFEATVEAGKLTYHDFEVHLRHDEGPQTLVFSGEADLASGELRIVGLYPVEALADALPELQELGALPRGVCAVLTFTGNLYDDAELDLSVSAEVDAKELFSAENLERVREHLPDEVKDEVPAEVREALPEELEERIPEDLGDRAEDLIDRLPFGAEEE